MKKWEIKVSGEFSARHALRLDETAVERSHEHRWEITATFGSEFLHEPMGVVVDFQIVRKIIDDIASQLDGTDLNDIGAFADTSPSAERVAEYLSGLIADRLDDGDLLRCVEVTEELGCSATFFSK